MTIDTPQADDLERLLRAAQAAVREWNEARASNNRVAIQMLSLMNEAPSAELIALNRASKERWEAAKTNCAVALDAYRTRAAELGIIPLGIFDFDSNA